MLSRYTLTAMMTCVLLAGCAPKQPDQAAVHAFDGPTRIDLSHIVTRTDDGSEVFVTVDGKEAGELPSGEDKTIHLPPGEHQIGGYVPTLFGYGRVTIEPITVTTTGNDVKNIAYTVAREKPEFTEITQTEG